MDFRRPTKKQRRTKKKQQQRRRPTKKIIYPELPQEIIIEILSFLPVKSLLQFRGVCKTWRDLIKNPSFIKKHLQSGLSNNDNFSLMVLDNDGDRLSTVDFHGESTGKSVRLDYPYKNEYTSVQILASCDGIFFLSIADPYNGTITSLWNPSTAEYKQLDLPEINNDDDDDVRIPLDDSDYDELAVYGFGYDCTIEDYKLVRLEPYAERIYDSICYDAKVYTLGLDSWTLIGDIPYSLDDHTRPGGVLVNGALHWIAYSVKEKSTRRVNLILAINIGTGKHREVSLPAKCLDDDVGINVGALEGCLCILCNIEHDSLAIWMMKDYGVRKSWSKLLTIVQPTVIQNFYSLKLVKMVKHGAILVNDGDESCFLVYGKNYGSVRKLKVVGSVQAYSGSLVSLGTGTYVEQFDVHG